MYVILVYDFGEKRVGKMLKLCRRYLNRVQNSVFEGEISEVRLKELLMFCDRFINKEEDCIIIFSGPSQTSLNKTVIGKECCKLDFFI